MRHNLFTSAWIMYQLKVYLCRVMYIYIFSVFLLWVFYSAFYLILNIKRNENIFKKFHFFHKSKKNHCLFIYQLKLEIHLFWFVCFFKIILINSTIKCSEIANENYPLPIHDVHTRSHRKCRKNHKDGQPPQPEILVQRKKHTFKSFCRNFIEKRLISIDIHFSSFRILFIKM